VRPKTHSGSRTPKSEWENTIALLQDELTRTRVKLRLAETSNTGKRLKKEKHAAPPVKIEEDSLAAPSSELYDEVQYLRQALTASAEREAAVRRDLEACRSELDANAESANGLARKNTWLNTRVQQLTLDLEWAVGLRKDKLAPPTVLRQKVRPPPTHRPQTEGESAELGEE
jgi:predicted  nucleic acid-binding Zn-ribbon protein